MFGIAPRCSALFAAITAALILTGCQGLAPGPPPVNPNGDLNKSVNHIIFMAQENRGFDHYFGRLPQYFAANNYPQTLDGIPADASNPTLDGTGVVTPFHMVSQCTEGISPFWNESHRDFNFEDPTSDQPAQPWPDGFVRIAALFAQGVGFHDVDGRRAMGYFDETDLPYYYFMAANFATSDRWFSPTMNNTVPNRLYMLAGTSNGHVYAPPQPMDIPTIFDELQAANISWRVYVTDDFQNPLFLGSALSMFVIAQKYPQNFVSAKQFVSDAQSGKLAQVTMIEPGYETGLDEHPYGDPNHPSDGVQDGSQYARSLIDGFTHSQSWNDSIFILTFDEAGGFYDHVPPQQTVSPDGIAPTDLKSTDICFGMTGGTCDFIYTGYRIPLIVISPFTKKNFVSHTPADSTAILRLIETRFTLKNLSARDAAQMDMTEFFDFQNVPWKTPPANIPGQPNDEQCNGNLPPQ